MSAAQARRAPGFPARLGRAAADVLGWCAKGIALLIVGLLVGVLAVRQPWPSLAPWQPYLEQVSPEDLRTEQAVDARVRTLPGPASEARPAYAPTGLWHLRSVRAQEAWNLLDVRGGGAPPPPVRVGVNDVFLDPGHPDLARNALPGLPDDAWATALSWLLNMGHGTGVLGLIAGRGTPGMTGVYPQAQLMPFSRLAAGRDPSVAASLRYFQSQGARVANFSMAAPWQVADQAAIDEAYWAGLLPVAGLYNRDTDQLAYPAAYHRVLVVSSVGPDDQAAGFGWGETLDVVAPGPWVLTTASGLRVRNMVFGKLYEGLCCNSAATAIASGAAALLLASDSTLTSAQVEKRLKLSARKTPGMSDAQGRPARWHPRYGYGVVDTYAALAYDRRGPDVLTLVLDPGGDGSIHIRGRAIDDAEDGGLEPGRARDQHLLGIPVSNVARVEFRLDGAAWRQAPLSPNLVYPVAAGDYIREFSFEFGAGLAAGEHRLEVRAWDSAGNQGEMAALEWRQPESR
ncbi:MAG: S8 family serine peptidase [Chloroflexi bacterium]|nr:S8 family serine peptidase [Chloroflexota bacterium]